MYDAAQPTGPAVAPNPVNYPALGPFGEELAALLPSSRRAALDGLLPGATVVQLQQAMAAGQLTAEELTAWHLDRIRRYSVNGLNAVIAVNPAALATARGLDAERKAGTVRGPLHGIPVLVKDNIATADPMPTTGGAYILKDWYATDEAWLVRRLRESGAVILAKANLSEWANWMDDSMPNGFSVTGGQTVNPYGPFDPVGSSSGSAVGVAADLAAVAVGTETTGSIIAPADANSVAGLKPSLGLISRSGVIPLIGWLDTPGPMGRTVTDVAVLLGGMTGVDPADPATQAAATLAEADFTQALRVEVARRLRVGVLSVSEATLQAQITAWQAQDAPPAAEQVQAMMARLITLNARAQAAAQVLQTQGIATQAIDVAELPPPTPIDDVLVQGFRDEFDAFWRHQGVTAPVDSLAATVAFNAEAPALRAPYGQGLLRASLESRVAPEDYQALTDASQHSAQVGLRRLLQEYGVDVLLIDDFTQLYAAAGFPALSVPAGYDEQGQPYGVTFTGDFLSEPQLLAVGYAYEQATQARRAPDLEARLNALAAAR